MKARSEPEHKRFGEVIYVAKNLENQCCLFSDQVTILPSSRTSSTMCGCWLLTEPDFQEPIAASSFAKETFVT